MSQAQCEYLVGHIDGARPVTSDHREALTRDILLRDRLITYGRGGTQQPNPTETFLTDKGRETLCIILGHWADILTRAAETKDNRLAMILPIKRGYGLMRHHV